MADRFVSNSAVGPVGVVAKPDYDAARAAIGAAGDLGSSVVALAASIGQDLEGEKRDADRRLREFRNRFEREQAANESDADRRLREFRRKMEAQLADEGEREGVTAGLDSASASEITPLDLTQFQPAGIDDVKMIAKRQAAIGNYTRTMTMRAQAEMQVYANAAGDDVEAFRSSYAELDERYLAGQDDEVRAVLQANMTATALGHEAGIMKNRMDTKRAHRQAETDEYVKTTVSKTLQGFNALAPEATTNLSAEADMIDMATESIEQAYVDEAISTVPVSDDMSVKVPPRDPSATGDEIEATRTKLIENAVGRKAAMMAEIDPAAAREFVEEYRRGEADIDPRMYDVDNVEEIAGYASARINDIARVNAESKAYGDSVKEAAYQRTLGEYKSKIQDGSMMEQDVQAAPKGTFSDDPATDQVRRNQMRDLAQKEAERRVKASAKLTESREVVSTVWGSPNVLDYQNGTQTAHVNRVYDSVAMEGPDGQPMSPSIFVPEHQGFISNFIEQTGVIPKAVTSQLTTVLNNYNGGELTDEQRSNIRNGIGMFRAIKSNPATDRQFQSVRKDEYARLEDASKMLRNGANEDFVAKEMNPQTWNERWKTRRDQALQHLENPETMEGAFNSVLESIEERDRGAFMATMAPIFGTVMDDLNMDMEPFVWKEMKDALDVAMRENLQRTSSVETAISMSYNDVQDQGFAVHYQPDGPTMMRYPPEAWPEAQDPIRNDTAYVYEQMAFELWQKMGEGKTLDPDSPFTTPQKIMEAITDGRIQVYQNPQPSNPERPGFVAEYFQTTDFESEDFTGVPDNPDLFGSFENGEFWYPDYETSPEFARRRMAVEMMAPFLQGMAKGTSSQLLQDFTRFISIGGAKTVLDISAWWNERGLPVESEQKTAFEKIATVYGNRSLMFDVLGDEDATD